MVTLASIKGSMWCHEVLKSDAVSLLEQPSDVKTETYAP